MISQDAAEQLVYMMNKVIEEGTGTRARLGDRPAAGKTGTTQAARDAWFLGFTADYVGGVWMGYDDNTPLTGVTGGGLPAEIWHEVMTRVHEGLPVHPLPMRTPAPAAVQTADTQGESVPVYDGTVPEYDGTVARSENDRLIGRVPEQQGSGNVAEQIINDVLGTIFGRN